MASGEGLYTLVSLVEALKRRAPAFSRVPGLVYCDQDRIRHNPGKPLVANLDDEMPRVAWDLLPMPKYRA